MRRLATVLALTLLAGPATAQVCGPHGVITDHLGSHYGETRQSIALAANNAVVEMFANLDTGSWTLLITVAGQRSCIAASGQAFDLTPTPPLTGDPA